MNKCKLINKNDIFDEFMQHKFYIVINDYYTKIDLKFGRIHSFLSLILIFVRNNNKNKNQKKKHIL